ncbi:MAG: hypothetical protein ABI587_07370 [Gemmatimonadales bacterium]
MSAAQSHDHDTPAHETGPHGTGHVFHPGHSELHGITVVVELGTGELYVGRYHEETPAGLLLHDAAQFTPGASATTSAEFVARMLKFGVRTDHQHVVVPGAAVRRVTRLVEWSGGQ